METFGPDCCGPCPASLHLTTFAFIAALPVGCCLLLPHPAAVPAAAACACVVALPRLLWLAGLRNGPWLAAVLGLYWNAVMLVCFGSPLLVALACWRSPRLCLPLALLWLLWTQVLSRPELAGGARWPLFSQREWGLHAFRRFLQLRLHVATELRDRPPERPVVIAIHPHGVASDYRLLMDGMLDKALPGRTALTLSASVLFKLPVVRELCLWTGCVDARRSAASWALRHGKSLAVIPGGTAEQLRTRTGHEEVLLANRLGFVKLALEHSAALVPCYAFGTVDLYDVDVETLWGAREWLRKRLGVCIPLYRGLLGFLPKQRPVNIVLGRPLEVRCEVRGAPTDAEVAAAHAAYVAALRRLFDEHKGLFGYEMRELIVA